MVTQYYKNNTYEILTDQGYKGFDGLMVSRSTDVVLIVTNVCSFYVTKDHELFYNKNDRKPICEYNVGDKLYSLLGNVFIEKIINVEVEMKVYDIINVYDINTFLIEKNLIKSKNCAYMDEFAFVDGDVDFYTSTYPVVSSGQTSKIIITSTPNGKNYFYKLWHDALNKQNGYVPYKVHWAEHPKRDQAWYDETMRNISPEKFSIEYECEFSGSDGTLINGKKLTNMSYSKPVQSIDNDTILVYEKPVEGRSYVAIVDVGEGIGQDYSTINIIDTTQMPYNQVFVYRNNKIVPNMFSTVIHQCCKKYNDALAVIESNNSGGGIVLDVLWNEIEYENILMSETKDSQNFAGWGKRSQLGVRTTKRTKSVGCSYLRDLIENDQLTVRDYYTLNELTTFIKVGSSYEAKKGAHDDLAMTLVIFAWLTSQSYFKDVTGVDVSGNLRSAIQMNSQEDYSNVLGGFYDGDDEDIDVITIH